MHAHTLSMVVFTAASIPLRPVDHVAGFLLPGVRTYEIRKVAGHERMLVNNA